MASSAHFFLLFPLSVNLGLSCHFVSVPSAAVTSRTSPKHLPFPSLLSDWSHVYCKPTAGREALYPLMHLSSSPCIKMLLVLHGPSCEVRGVSLNLLHHFPSTLLLLVEQKRCVRLPMDPNPSKWACSLVLKRSCNIILTKLVLCCYTGLWEGRKKLFITHGAGDKGEKKSDEC